MSQQPQSKAMSMERARLCALALLPVVAILAAILFDKIGFVPILAVYLVVAAGITVLFRTDWATYLFVGLIYANVPAVAVKFMGVPKVAAAGVFGLLFLPLVYYLLVRKKPLVVAKPVPWIFGLVVVQLISSVVAQRMDTSMPVIITSLIEGLLLFGLITNVVRTPKVLLNATLALIFVGGLLGGLSLFQKATNTFDRDYGGFAQKSMVERNGKKIVAPNPRSVGPVGEKNYYAQFMLLLVPLGIVLIRTTENSFLRSMLIASTILIVIGIGLTASRGAAVGFLLLIGAMYYLRVLDFQKVLIVLVCAVSFVVLSEGFRERISDLLGVTSVMQTGGDVREVDKSLQGRASEMLAAVIVFQQNPILGVGAGNFPFHFAQNADVLGFQVHGEERLAHCSYLEIAAETGAMGLICFLAVFYITIMDLIKARKLTTCSQSRALATGFLLTVGVLMVTSVFLSFAYIRYYWLILGLATCAARIALAQSDDEIQQEESA